MGTEVPVSARVFGDRYRLGRLLGRGGMAEVYEGHDERLDRPVALKLLRPGMTANPEVRSRFEAEARSAARLAHPNVVAVFDTGEDQGTPYIVMERLPGETLADRMAAGPVDQAWLRRVAGDVLGALRAAHAAGVVHRDVKPGNILLAADGCAKVADFGIAKSIEVAGVDLTATGLLVGTPAYLAPERLEGLPATARSDLYSLGVVLYEALSGEKPFTGATPVAVANAARTERPAPLRDLRPDVEPTFAAAIEQALERDPALRPSSAAAMAAAMRVAPAATTLEAAAPAGADPTLVAEAGLFAPPPAGPSGRDGARTAAAAVPRWPRRPLRPGTPRLVAVATAALLVLVVVAVAAGGGSGEDLRRRALAEKIDELAGRVETGDGPRGPAAAERLRAVARQVASGGGADGAEALLVEVAGWNAEGLLSPTATRQIAALLDEVPGVDAATAMTTTTTTAATTQPPPEPEDEEEDEERKGRGRKGRGHG